MRGLAVCKEEHLPLSPPPYMRHFIALAMGLAYPAVGPAQVVSGSLDVGTARMKYADSIEAASASISPAVRIVSSRASLNAFGTFSQLSGASTHSGGLNAAVVPFAHRQFSTEIVGAAGGSTHGNGTRTGQMMGSARLYVAGGSRGAWVGAGGGRTWDGLWRNVAQGEAGAWFRFRAASLAASIAPAAVDDSIRYADAFVSLRAEMSQWELDATAGYRDGELPVLPANRNGWGSVSGTWWATSRLGLVVAAGSYPVDFTQGYPGGQYVSLSARLRSVPMTIRRQTPEVSRTAEAGLRAFTVRRVTGDSHQIAVHAPGARRVELSGDFTMWSPVTMRAAGNGWWTAVLRVPRGSQEVNVRIDGGAWLVPPGTTPKRDEFGGAVGVVIVR